MSCFLREIDDVEQSGNTPNVNLNSSGVDEDFILVDKLSFRIIVKITKSTAGAGTWTLLQWLVNSNLQSFWRIGGKADGAEHVCNVPLLHLGRLAELIYNGSIETADDEFPASVALTGTGTQDTFEFALRVGLAAPVGLASGDDGSIRLSEIGLQRFNFGAHGTASTTIDSIRVIAMADARPTNAKRAGVLSKIERQSCQAPKTQDSIPVAVGEAVEWMMLSSEESTDDVADCTFPQVFQNGRPLIEGSRLANVQTLAQVRGEVFYPQLVTQSNVAPTTFAAILLPNPRTKTSELPADKSISIRYTANGLTDGAAFYVLKKYIALDPVQAAVRLGGSIADGERQVANAGKPLTSAAARFVPVEV